MVVEEKEDVLTRTGGWRRLNRGINGKGPWNDRCSLAAEIALWPGTYLNRIVLTHALRWGNNKSIRLQGDEGTYKNLKDQ